MYSYPRLGKGTYTYILGTEENETADKQHEMGQRIKTVSYPMVKYIPSQLNTPKLTTLVIPSDKCVRMEDKVE